MTAALIGLCPDTHTMRHVIPDLKRLWLLNSARNISELKKSSLAKQVSSSGLLQGVLSVGLEPSPLTLFPVMISTFYAND